MLAQLARLSPFKGSNCWILFCPLATMFWQKVTFSMIYGHVHT